MNNLTNRRATGTVFAPAGVGLQRLRLKRHGSGSGTTIAVVRFSNQNAVPFLHQRRLAFPSHTPA